MLKKKYETPQIDTWRQTEDLLYISGGTTWSEGGDFGADDIFGGEF